MNIFRRFILRFLQISIQYVKAREYRKYHGISSDLGPQQTRTIINSAFYIFGIRNRTITKFVIILIAIKTPKQSFCSVLIIFLLGVYLVVF